MHQTIFIGLQHMDPLNTSHIGTLKLYVFRQKNLNRLAEQNTIVKTFEETTGVKIPYSIKERRAGDIDANYADASKAKKELGWEAKYGVKEMCADSWRWQSQNPNGYED